MVDDPQPRLGAANRAGRQDAAEAGGDRPPIAASPARSEPTVDIRPPRWFVVVARVGVLVYALLGAAATAAAVGEGRAASAVVSLLGAAALAAMAFDASTRSAVSHGNELVLHQWFRSRRLRRADTLGFEAQRASFFRWDIVAVPVEGTQVRLWVTRMLPAGRVRRQAWLTQLEAWRTWVGPSSDPPDGR